MTTCLLCGNFGVVHPHVVAMSMKDGTSVLGAWCPSRGVYWGLDRCCPACSGSFDPILDEIESDPCDGACGELPAEES